MSTPAASEKRSESPQPAAAAASAAAPSEKPLPKGELGDVKSEITADGMRIESNWDSVRPHCLSSPRRGAWGRRAAMRSKQCRSASRVMAPLQEKQVRHTEGTGVLMQCGGVLCVSFVYSRS
jgi:hypothetical protein